MTDFDEYIRQGEPSQKEKAQNGQTAIGLQQVDGLTPSAYLIQTAKEKIKSDLGIFAMPGLGLTSTTIGRGSFYTIVDAVKYIDA